MAVPILATKLYIPPARSKIVLRPRLIERLNASLSSGRTAGVTLISAPAGFGKTTLLSEWINQEPEGGRKKDEAGEIRAPSAFASHPSKVAWLSLDEGDNDPSRFLSYLIAALQTLAPNVGARMLPVLQSPQPPPIESILTSLINEIMALPEDFTLVLDDYHVIDAKPVDYALTFLIEHLPPQMHLVIATREDPSLPLARLRARGQLTELRAADLRFTHPEAAEFLNEVMNLKLSKEDIVALERRTEGWVAGLQLAALSMQGQKDTSDFIQSFTGSHHFVMDYLVEEVLGRQPEHLQTFLLRTSILNRMCGSLCEAVVLDPSTSGNEILKYLERANLFVIPLDSERRWYRYHHLFADLLRQRLRQSFAPAPGDSEHRVKGLHIRASQWYEDNGLDIEAFHHAAAANDIERAERLIEGKGIPLHLRGAVTAIVNWLESLPANVKNARPWLWWRHAALLLVIGQTTGVEEKLQAAEDGLRAQQHTEEEKSRIWVGRIAAARAVLALTRYQADTMIAQSLRALEFLPPNHLATRANANWTLGFAYVYKKDYAAARRALTEAITLSQAAGDVFTSILATIGLGNVEEAENHLHRAAETYRRVLQWAGDQPLQIIYEAHLGLARVLYQWNDLDAAEQHGEQSLYLARQYDRVIDRFIVCEVFLARLKLARGKVDEAATMLGQADQSARQRNFVHRIPEVAEAQVLTLLRQGNLTVADQLAQRHGLPLSQARIYLARRAPSAASEILEPLRQQAETSGWANEQLSSMILQAIAFHADGEKDKALEVLGEALSRAEPEGFIRIFVEEGAPMAHLLSEAAAQGIQPDYTGKLLAVLDAEKWNGEDTSSLPSAHPPIEPLTPRELEVLRLIAQGLSNDQIGKQLYLALDTVKGHNRRIYDKLQVQRRTEAVARARELGLL